MSPSVTLTLETSRLGVELVQTQSSWLLVCGRLTGALVDSNRFGRDDFFGAVFGRRLVGASRVEMQLEFSFV